MIAYRYPNEQLILAATLALVAAVLLLTAASTLCLAPLLIVVVALVAYQLNHSHHQALLRQALRVSPQQTPELAALVSDTVRRLDTAPVECFVAPRRALNAYTFGLSSPQVVVLYSPLLEVMDGDELRFILGHELGHVALGHTWINTLLGGMGGIPTSFGAAVILTLAFRWWNRACEYSCDRAGLLACGKPQKAITALVKLVAGDIETKAELQRALRLIEQEDDSPINLLAETLSTHPMLVRRIEHIRRYAASVQYRRLQAQVEQRGAR